MAKIKIGDVYKIRAGSYVEVLDYKGALEVVVKHLDSVGYVTTVRSDHLRKGNIKNPYGATVKGMGYIGVGRHSVVESGTVSPAYRSWAGVLERVYCTKYLAKRPTYAGTQIFSEWLNFQNFADWFKAQPNSGRIGFDLDKDLRVPGSKEYSPETCSFVPTQINSILNDCRASSGNLPRGVRRNRKGFSARVSNGGELQTLGTFKTAEVAYTTYREAKMNLVREAAARFEGVIHHEVYSYLTNWTLPEYGEL